MRSWVTCKLCRCFSKQVPCRNQLLSISLQIAFRLCFRVCCMLLFFATSSSGELRFLFMDFLGISPFAKKTAILTCSMIAKLLLLNSFPSGCDALTLYCLRRCVQKIGMALFFFASPAILHLLPPFDDGHLNKVIKISIFRPILYLCARLFLCAN